MILVAVATEALVWRCPHGHAAWLISGWQVTRSSAHSGDRKLFSESEENQSRAPCALRSFKVPTETAPLPSQDADMIPRGSCQGDKWIKANLMLYLEWSLSANCYSFCLLVCLFVFKLGILSTWHGDGGSFLHTTRSQGGLRELSSDHLQHTHVCMYVRMYVMTRRTSGEGDKCAYRSEYRMIDSNPFLFLLFSFP